MKKQLSPKRHLTRRRRARRRVAARAVAVTVAVTVAVAVARFNGLRARERTANDAFMQPTCRAVTPLLALLAAMRRRRAVLAAVALIAVASAATARGLTTCYAAPTPANDRRSDASSSRITIGTFNAMFLFDGVGDVAVSPYSGGTAADVAAADAHIVAVRDGVVRALDVDVLVVAEAETCGTLARIAAANVNYAAGMIDGTDTYTGQEIGMLTKVDVEVDFQRTEVRGEYSAGTSSCGYVGSKDSAVSKHFWTRIKIVNRYVSIIAAHLKANPTEASSCAQREAQVEVLRDLVTTRYATGDAVVVLGDLNDYSAKYMDVSGNVPTSRVIANLRDFDGDGVDEFEEVSSVIAQSSRYTYQSSSGSSKSMLDHILVSKADIDIVDATIRHDVVSSRSVSDHFPLVATLDILAERNESRLPTSSSTTPRDTSVWRAFVVAGGVAAVLLHIAH